MSEAEQVDASDLASAIGAGRSNQDQAARIRVRAAWMYYIENQTQSDIAKRLGISRVTVVRLLADARRRGEVRISIEAPLADLAALERSLESRYGIGEVIIAPHSGEGVDATPAIAAAAGAYISQLITPDMTVGVGWGRTLHMALPHIMGRTLDNLRVVSLLGGIAQARRFNPAEFAWQFAELFRGEGFLVPAPALVDCPETKHALLEQCGLSQVFELAKHLDVALLSAGGIDTLTTSYRIGHLSESDRRSLMTAGAVGDVLYNFFDADGRIIDHPVNHRVISADPAVLARAPRRVMISGGPEKVAALKASFALIPPTTLITDETTARALLTAG